MDRISDNIGKAILIGLLILSISMLGIENKRYQEGNEIWYQLELFVITIKDERG
jgi:hypothetical protein